MLDGARVEAILGRARERAAELNIAACIAIVDPGAHLVAFHRMDGAMLGPIDVSLRKARTAVLFQAPTGDFGAAIREHDLEGMTLTNGGLAAFHGGLPIRDGEFLVGGLGISGGSADQDLDIARHALR